MGVGENTKKGQDILSEAIYGEEFLDVIFL